MLLSEYIDQWLFVTTKEDALPWILTEKIEQIVQEKINALDSTYTVNGNIAIHKSAIVEENVILKGPIIISANCFIGAHAYLRKGVYLSEHVSVGPGCEIKSSFLLNHSSLAHFNFVGDSILGSYANMEAGSIIANHFNERSNKVIDVMIDSKQISTEVEKFGALVGDHSKIGANAVLSPGTILTKRSIVKRLELVNQLKYR